MFNTSGYNKDFREWSESIMTFTQERIKKLREAQRDLQWQYDMELYRLESEIKKKEEAIDDLNSSLFEMAQANTDKDKQIKELQEELESTKHELFYTRANNRFLNEALSELQNEKRADLEKRIEKLEERLIPKDTTVETDEQLKRYRWYNSTDFTQEELLKKLGTGVLVEVILDPFKDNKGQDPEKTEVKTVRVHYISKNVLGKTVLSIGELYYRHWFRII